MECIPGFAWPVPRAFAGAVSSCRFEQGDVLYDSAVAYQAPSARKRPGYHIQVLDPLRSARGASGEGGRSRFLANWSAEVTFDLHDYRSGETEAHVSTQGRLFTCLWRGDPKILASGASAASEPTPPTPARELQGRLEEALPSLRARVRATPGGTRGAASSGGSGAARQAWLFAFVVDESSDASLAKRRTLEAALASRFETDRFALSPGEAGLDASDAFHPALQLQAIRIDSSNQDAIRDALKSALYMPNRDRGTAAESDSETADDAPDSSPEKDRFRLERHGLLVSTAED